MWEYLHAYVTVGTGVSAAIKGSFHTLPESIFILTVWTVSTEAKHYIAPIEHNAFYKSEYLKI